MGRRIRRTRVTRFSARGAGVSRADVLAAEEPLQIRVREHTGEASRDLTVTMRTPGDDFDLVAGFLAGEGIIRTAADLLSMRYCAGEDEQGQQTYNVIDATLAPGVPLPPLRAERQVTTTSACGICGTTSIQDVRRITPPTTPDGQRFALDTLLGLPDALRADQTLFARTGGVHAAGAFDAGGSLVCLREDVGRHNAVDKVVGWALREGRLPLRGHVLQVSGRASFELVQKAHVAGFPVLAAVGAPSSLAVDLATDVGLTLIGFSRGTSLNVYSHPERVEDSAHR